MKQKSLQRILQRLEAASASAEPEEPQKFDERVKSARNQFAKLGLRSTVRAEVVAEPTLAMRGSEVSVRVLIDPEEIELTLENINLDSLKLNEIRLEMPRLTSRLAERNATTKKVEVILSGSVPSGSEASLKTRPVSVSAEVNGFLLEGYRIFPRP